MRRALSLLTLLALVGCTPPEDERIWDLRKHLESNTGNVERIIRYGSFEDGIEDLRNVLADASDEESYVFLPEENVWIESGREEDYASVMVEVGVIDRFLFSGDEVVVVHYHPLLDDVLERLASNVNEHYGGTLSADVVEGLAYLANGMPGLADFSTVFMSYSFAEVEEVDINFSGVVSSFYGWIRYTKAEDVVVNDIFEESFYNSLYSYNLGLVDAWLENPYQPWEFEDDNIRVTFHPY